MTEALLGKRDEWRKSKEQMYDNADEATRGMKKDVYIARDSDKEVEPQTVDK